MTDLQYIINLKSNVSDCEILLNGESKGTSPNKILLTTKEVQDNYNGRVNITLQKTNYTPSIRYELFLDRNPAYDSFVLSQQLALQSQQGGSDFDPTSNNTEVYSNIPQFILRVNKYENNVLVEYQQDLTNQLLELDFNLTASQSNNSDQSRDDAGNTDDPQGFKVLVNGLLSSAKFIVNNSEQIVIDKNSGVYNFNVGDTVEIASSDITAFRITKITAKGIGIDSSQTVENDLESLRFRVAVTRPLVITIDTVEVFAINQLPPFVSLLKDETRIYNINSNTDYPVGIIRNGAVTSLRVVVGNEVITYSDIPPVEQELVFDLNKYHTPKMQNVLNCNI